MGAHVSLRGGGPVIDACRAAGDAQQLRAEVRAPLARWIPFDAYCVNTCDPITLHVTSSVGDGLPSRDALHLFAIESARADVNLLADLARARVGAAIVSKATAGRVERSRRMREIFLPLGLRDELRAPLFDGDHCWGYLHLLRGRRPFTDDDAARVARIAPFVARALRRAVATACAPSPPRVGPPADESSPGLVVMERDGAARIATGSARATLRALDFDGHQPVSHGVYAVAQHARRGSETTACVRSPAGDWVALHGVAFGTKAAAPTAIVAPASPAQIAPVALLAHGLTAREREVAELLIAGASNADVARELAIGVFTVKDHVKSVFRKTRDSGRQDLAAILQGRRSES
jgi:DNA-binding CsgD family transcriptional regulator